MQEERLTMEEASQNSDAYNIQHFVSKMDTLAGLAIKYGVEVVISFVDKWLLLFSIILIFF